MSNYLMRNGERKGDDKKNYSKNKEDNQTLV